MAGPDHTNTQAPKPKVPLDEVRKCLEAIRDLGKIVRQRGSEKELWEASERLANASRSANVAIRPITPDLARIRNFRPFELRGRTYPSAHAAAVITANNLLHKCFLVSAGLLPPEIQECSPEGFVASDQENIRVRDWCLREVGHHFNGSGEPLELYDSPLWAAAQQEAAALQEVRVVEGSVQWYTVSEAAKVAGCNKGVITRAVDAGELRCNSLKGRSRRVDAVDLTRWILARSNRPEPSESTAAVKKLVNKHVHN